MKHFLSVSPSINLDHFFHDIGDAICIGDKDMNMLGVNENFAAFYGKKPADLLNQSPLIFYPQFKSSVFYDGMKKTIETGETTIRIGYSNNLKSWIVVRSVKLTQPNLYATIIHKIQNEIEKGCYVSPHDTLTSLKNRFSFENDLQQIHKLRSNYGVFIVDINKFKLFNENLGYDVGDFCLMEIGARIKANVASFGEVYRIGPDQFAAIIPSPHEICIDKIENVINKCKEKLTVKNSDYTISVSIGFNYIDNFEQNFTDVLSNTEFALNKAKKYTNYFVEYQNKSTRNTKKLDLIRELKSSMLLNEIEIFYQPQIDLIESKVCGAEALIRWKKNGTSYVSPGEFLPVAEEYSFMQEIDKYVFTKTINNILEFKKFGISTPISINFSSQTICNTKMPDLIDFCFNKFALSPEDIIIEITEGSIMEDVYKSKQTISQLEKKWVKIALDDFGTGYSSMGYLMRYPTHFLKIDREFITNINISENLQILTGNIIKLGHSLGMHVIAEGVETLDELNCLKQLNCNSVQGYFYSKPLHKEDFIKFVKKHGLSNLKSSIF